MDTRTVYVPLTMEEYAALRELADAECRDPKEQARYLIRVGLGLTGRKSAETQYTIQTNDRDYAGRLISLMDLLEERDDLYSERHLAALTYLLDVVSVPDLEYFAADVQWWRFVKKSCDSVSRRIDDRLREIDTGEGQDGEVHD